MRADPGASTSAAHPALLDVPGERQVPFLDLRVDDQDARREILDAVETVLRHGRLILGPEVSELERRVAERCGRRHAVALNSGTDALLIALRSIGIGPGDEVITTSLSWIATANAIALTGATPVFADVRDDLNLDPASVQRLVGPRTRAIVPVHYTGRICDMIALQRIADAHGLHVVEDAAQAFDATYHGRKAGSFGTVGCFSMNAMKVFAACGEAGMAVTDSDDAYERMLALRYNGTINREICIETSLNARMDTIQAAILLRRLPTVQRIVARRRDIARWYREMLSRCVATPSDELEVEHVYYTYTILAERRDELREHLGRHGIETKIQHPYLMPQQPTYRHCRSETRHAAEIVKRVLCLPVHERLEREDVAYVARRVREFFAAGA